MSTLSPRAGAAAGAVAVLLFAAGALVSGERTALDASGAEVAADLAARRTGIHVGLVLNALWVPLLVWFLATVVAEAGEAGRRGARVALGCGLVFAALFLADNTALAVGALRPENMARAPELAAALRDFEWLAMGMAAPTAAGMLAALATLAVWPRWLGALAFAAAGAYLLRTGTLVTDSGPFAADGVLGLWLPVAAVAAWLVVASVSLTLRLSPE